jgi:hypothetical protein
MKSKLSMKLLGIVVTIATVSSLLVGITAAPVSAAPGTLAYSVVDTPSKANNVLVDGNQMSFMVASTDGATIFAYDATNHFMYKSTNSGVTFSKVSGTTPFASGTAVGLAISPNYATDNTVVLAETLKVYYSTNGGTSWVDCAPDALTIKLEGGNTITSVDVGTYYADSGNTSILIGVKTNAGGTTYGNVLKFKFGFFTWDEVQATGVPFLHDVYAVKYSPNHLSDVAILCVYDDGGAAVVLSAKVGTFGWNFATYPDVTVKAAAAITTATIGLSPSFTYSAGAGVLVGATGAGAGLYYVKSSTPLAVIMAGAVNSISVMGDSYATVYAGLTTDNKVYKSTTVTASTVTFSSTGTSGTGGTTVVAKGTKVFATTTGAEGAFSVSLDNGASFYQTALINVTLASGVSLADIQTIDNNTMFLLVKNTTGQYYIFKTTDGAATWQRIQVFTAATALLSVSPAYVTDTTVAYDADASAIVYKSVNGGTSFSAVPTAAANVYSLYLGPSGNIYVGDTNGFFKAGRWVNATGLSSSDKVVSIAVNPKDTTGATIAVGTAVGKVYVSTNDGVSFTATVNSIGAIPGGGTENMFVAYAPDGTLYTLGDGATGIKRLDAGVWSGAIQAVADGAAIDIGADGTLYATDYTTLIGIWRSLTPAATSPEFYAMNSTNFASILGPTGADSTAHFSNESIVSTATDNTIYVLDQGYAAGTSYGYTGRLVGFKDTFIVAPVQTTPAAGALVTGTDSADVSWTAFTGAKNYQINVNTKSDFTGTDKSPANTSSTTATSTTLSQGATYSWRVRVASTNSTNTFLSRWSTTRTFITALVAPTAATPMFPLQGATNVAVDTTFTWPTAGIVAGATYEFVIAEDLGNVDKFAIIDYSATCPTNATALRETLKYDTTYWWRVRTVTGTSKSDWTTSFFTTAPEPVVPPTTPTTPAITPTITVIVPTQPAVTPTIINSGSTGSTTPVIPTYLLWAVIAVGAVLVIAVIVLIVRTRRIP